jgi:hypothetical protein
MWSRHSLGYRLDDRVSILSMGRIFSLCHRVQSDSGAHAGSYPMGTGGFFPGSKAAGGGVKLTTHLQLVPRLRMRGAIPTLTHTS